MEKANENVVKITREEVTMLGRAIYDLSASCPSMKGKVVFALSKNEGKIESVQKKIRNKNNEIVEKYVEFDKDKNPVLTEPSEEEIAKGARAEYVYKDKKKGHKNAEKELSKFMQEEVEMEFHKIWLNDFEKLDIPTSRNQAIGAIIKYLVSEENEPTMAITR